MLRAAICRSAVALVLFVIVGLIHGYALGESIYGAEPTPLYAYLVGSCRHPERGRAGRHERSRA